MAGAEPTHGPGLCCAWVQWKARRHPRQCVIGLEETKHTKTGLAVQQTVVSRSVPLRLNTQADLYDASGRKAAVLRPGPNDISHLAPGVYFVREEPQAASSKPQAVQKVVVTR